ICPEVASIMAKALGRDDHWIKSEVSTYTTLARQYILHEKIKSEPVTV
ncbi:MAG: hypothetical protein H0U44_11095, partial [Flavisolibacter sp.]|nr:hypothetical protein [Flavisolibacter sp.]